MSDIDLVDEAIASLREGDDTQRRWAMPRWEDATSYKRGEKRGEVEPRAWSFEGLTGIRPVVTRHIDHGDDAWLLRCPPRFDLHPLDAKGAEGAKREALGLVYGWLSLNAASIYRFLEDERVYRFLEEERTK